VELPRAWLAIRLFGRRAERARQRESSFDGARGFARMTDSLGFIATGSSMQKAE
jgi:hypothetical protein